MVASSEDECRLLDVEHETASTTSDQAHLRPCRGCARRDGLLLVSLFAVLCSGLLLSWLVLRTSPISRDCWDRHNFPSPAMREIDLEYHEVQFNGTLDYPSPYRGKPSEQVDAAWDVLVGVRGLSATRDDIQQSGNELASVQIPLEKGGGYYVALEFPHQLHCLNLIRKSLWMNIDYYRNRTEEYEDPPDIVQMHVDHCIETLRQNLMCHADVGIISHHWVRDHPYPFPDFNVWKKCRNFESILSWAQDHQLPTKENGKKWEPEQPMEGEKIWDSEP